MIDIFSFSSIMRLIQFLLDLLISLNVLADDLGVYLKGQLGLFGGLMQEAVDKYKDESLHVLLLGFLLKAFLDELILRSFLDVHQQDSNQNSRKKCINQAHLLRGIASLNVIRKYVVCCHPKQHSLHEILHVKVLLLICVDRKQPMPEDIQPQEGCNQEDVDHCEGVVVVNCEVNRQHDLYDGFGEDIVEVVAREVAGA